MSRRSIGVSRRSGSASGSWPISGACWPRSTGCCECSVRRRWRRRLTLDVPPRQGPRECRRPVAGGPDGSSRRSRTRYGAGSSGSSWDRRPGHDENNWNRRRSVSATWSRSRSIECRSSQPPFWRRFSRVVHGPVSSASVMSACRSPWSWRAPASTRPASTSTSGRSPRSRQGGRTSPTSRRLTSRR